ncbi:MAG: DUF3300 domain-containing protein [Pirellulaceae bacterium]
MKCWYSNACACALAALLGMVTLQSTQAQQTAANEDLPASLLSPEAMDAVVSGYAFYPDDVFEQILHAAQTPQQVHQAAQGQLPADASESVRSLARYPQLLTQMDQQLAVTARLGLAARTQIEDVWAALDRVRAGFAESQAAQQAFADEGSAAAGGGGGAAGMPPGYGAYAAGFWTGIVANEIRQEYYEHLAWQNAVVATGAGSQTVTGPYGNSATITGGAAGGYATQGATTYGAAAGAGAVTGPGGNTVYGAGGATGSVTNTGAGYEYNSSATGGVVNPATGAYAGGTRDSSGYAQQNADGSTTFGRNSTTSTQSSYGGSTINHQSSGTAAGPGASSYNGATSVSSTYGNVAVETQAGGGQATSTVTTDNGSKTLTAGDGSIGSTSSSTARQTSATADPAARTSTGAARCDHEDFSRNARSSLNTARQGLTTGSAGAFSRPTAGSISRPSAASRSGSSLSTRPSAGVRTSPVQRSYSGGSFRGGGRRGR